MRFSGWGAAVEAVERLMAERSRARAVKDYATADAVRRQIEAVRVGWYGVEIEDAPQGSTWQWAVKDAHPTPIDHASYGVLISGGTGQRSDSKAITQ